MEWTRSSLAHLVIQQTFTACLLCARPCAGLWGHSRGWDRWRSLPSWRLCSNRIDIQWKSIPGKEFLARKSREQRGICGRTDLWDRSWTWCILGTHRKLSLGLMLNSLAVHLMTELHWDKERGHTPSPAVCPLLTKLNPELAVKGEQSRGSSAGSQAVHLRVDLERRSNTLITGTGTKC